MTSSKKKHHPPGAAGAPAAPRAGTSSARSVKAQQPAASPVKAADPADRRKWIIRSIAVLAIAIGLSITMIGVTPDIAGGWGKLVLSVPGMVIATGGFIAFVETTSMARSRRR